MATWIIRWWEWWVCSLITPGNIIYVSHHSDRLNIEQGKSQIFDFPPSTSWESDPEQASERTLCFSLREISIPGQSAEIESRRNKESFRAQAKRAINLDQNCQSRGQTDSTPRLRDTISKRVFAVILLIWLSYTTNTCTAVPQSWNCKYLTSWLLFLI